MVDVQHKQNQMSSLFHSTFSRTQPDHLPSYHILFPFTLRIPEFKVPNEARSHKIDAIIKKKNVSFNTPLCYSQPTENTPKQSLKLKPVLKWNITDNNTFQDHHSPQVQSLQDHFLPLQDHSLSLQDQKPPFQDNFPTQNSIENSSLQDHVSVKDVQDIISLKKAIPQSFEHYRQYDWVYTIWLDPSVPPVQHVRRKVPIECREAIGNLLQHMVD